MELVTRIDRLSQNGMLKGIVYWKIGNVSYPDVDWVDNINVVIGWWLSSLDHLATQKGSENFKFMEGPYTLQLNPLSIPGAYEMKTDDRQISESCDIQFVIAEVIRVCREIATWYFNNGCDIPGAQYRNAADTVARKWHQ